MISRRAQAATLGVMAGLLVVSGGLTGAALAEVHGYPILNATSPCGIRPAGGPGVASLVTTRPRAAASSSPGPTTSPAATSTPTPTPPPTHTPTPPPTHTPTPPPTHTPTPPPTHTPPPPPKPAQLCVLVQRFSSSSVRPGQTADFEIWVWSTVAAAQGVTVTATLGNVAHVDAPGFTVCPRPNGAVCAVGTLPTGQSEELVAGASVRRAASAGERITLTATAKGSKAGSFHAAATISVIAASSPSPSPPPSPSPSPTLPPGTVPPGGVPPLPGGPLNSPSGNPSGLFPTIAPGSSSPAGTAGRGPNPSNARDVSATLPLDSRLIGGQLAGLALLATAIAIAIARLSLRGTRPRDGGNTTK